MNITTENINNLTSIWKIVSQPFHSYFEKEEFAFCYIENAEWPNRIWLQNKSLNSSLSKITETISDNKNSLTFSYFDFDKGNDLHQIERYGFAEKSIQYGMSIQLQEPFVLSNRLTFRKVSSGKEIRQWCTSFQQSFNYQISEKALEKSINRISYFNILHDNSIVGTLILHVTNQVAGIHSLGIVPQWRGHGFAKEAMYFTLNKAIELKANYATLQASEMARSMYKNLGFSENFIMRNYQLNK